MKLIVPVFGIMFGAGMCCCGDVFSDAMEAGMEDAMKDVEGGTAGGGTTAGGTTSGGTTTVATPTGSATLGALCGPFGGMDPPAPAGFSVMACVSSSTIGGGSTLTLTGSGDPAAICKPFKGWAESKGYNVTASGEAGGTGYLTATKGAQRMTLSCSNMSGQTLISIVLSGG
jgi:hypothetical protein